MHAEEHEGDARRDDGSDDRRGGNEARRALSCPAATIMGTRKADSAAASATADPDRADRIASRPEWRRSRARLAMSDEGKRDVDDAFGQSAGIHDLASENEERHGEEGKAVNAVDDVLRDDLRIHHVHVEHQRNAADEQRKRDGHADCHGRRGASDEDDDGHGDASLTANGRCRRRGGPPSRVRVEAPRSLPAPRSLTSRALRRRSGPPARERGHARMAMADTRTRRRRRRTAPSTCPIRVPERPS